jgi:hypothetical protein
VRCNGLNFKICSEHYYLTILCSPVALYIYNKLCNLELAYLLHDG